MRVNVKLVSGLNIGTVAIEFISWTGVIHVSGGGSYQGSFFEFNEALRLTLELGLLEVHKVLLDNGLRESVTLRVNGV